MKNGTRFVPQDWLVSIELQQWAATECPHVDLRAETAQFRDHEFRRPYTQWDRVWRNWMRKAEQSARQKQTRAPSYYQHNRQSQRIYRGPDEPRPGGPVSLGEVLRRVKV